MSKIPLIVCYDGRWVESNKYVNYKMIGLLADDKCTYLLFLLLLFKELPLQLDASKHYFRLLVDMKFDCPRNNIVEITMVWINIFILQLRKEE